MRLLSSPLPLLSFFSSHTALFLYAFAFLCALPFLPYICIFLHACVHVCALHEGLPCLVCLVTWQLSLWTWDSVVTVGGGIGVEGTDTGMAQALTLFLWFFCSFPSSSPTLYTFLPPFLLPWMFSLPAITPLLFPSFLLPFSHLSSLLSLPLIYTGLYLSIYLFFTVPLLLCFHVLFASSPASSPSLSYIFFAWPLPLFFLPACPRFLSHMYYYCTRPSLPPQLPLISCRHCVCLFFLGHSYLLPPDLPGSFFF